MADIVEYYGPGEYAPVDARGFSLLKAVGRFLAGPGSDLAPRKGGGGVEATQQMLNSRRETGQDQDVKQRRFMGSPTALKQLAEADDIIFSIRRTLKNAIGDMAWKIVPDTGKVKDEIQQWASVVALRIAMPGIPVDFKPKAMSLKIYQAAQGTLHDYLVEMIESGADPRDLGSNHRYRQFFDNILAAHEAIARSHCAQVQQFLDRPNPSAESSWRALQNLIIDDVTLYDGSAIVKNVTEDGRIGELYTLPGEEIEIYRNKDKSTPQPPYIAYQHVVEGQVKALFNNVELVYVMANNQNTGYGLSPVEVLVKQMIGAQFADAYLIDWYQQNNMPFFVFDLGPGVGPDERDAVERRWDQRVQKGRHRGIFVANKENVKGFIPMPQASNRDAEVMAQLKFWANRKCAAYGLSLNDIGFTEDLHRTTAETQADLTQSRGVSSFANVLQSYINREIVQGQMWVRRDPENPNDLDGEMKPCFPFQDVRFEYLTDESAERLQKGQMIQGLVAGGLMTINEGRDELKLASVPGGDEAVVFTAGSVKVRDLPDLPGPPEGVAAIPGQDGTTGGDDGPSLSGDGGGDQPAALAKAAGTIDALANRLRKLAGG